MRMTGEDEELQILTNVIGDGWAETLAQAGEFDRRQKQVIELYRNCGDELTADDGLVYRGHRLVIPAKEHSNIVKSLMNRMLGSKEHCDGPAILSIGLESQPSSKITYQSAEFATVTGPNNVKSL